MACYHPAKAYLTSSGGVSFTELARDQVVADIKLPCGQCIGCRLDRARDWSLRIGHESKLHSPNWFLTLTYDDKNLPTNGSLVYSDVQAFYKRLRFKLGPFRHFTVGEYGEQTLRPHYHAIIFGLVLPDLQRFGGTKEQPEYRSQVISDTWGMGLHHIGSVSTKSISYVARYALKKVNGDLAEKHYQGRSPEFCHMSTKPGIGHDWFMKYHPDVTTHDYVIRDGVKNPVPRYYDKLFKRQGGELDVTKMGRQASARLRASDNTPERLVSRETVAKARSNLNTRKRI